MSDDKREPTHCQWCGAPVKLRFCRPDTDVHQMLVFACDVEWYAEEGDNAWPRRAPLKCGQRCAEQMRRLRGVSHNTVTVKQLEQVEKVAGWAIGDITPRWRIIAESVRVMIDSVTKGGNGE